MATFVGAKGSPKYYHLTICRCRPTASRRQLHRFVSCFNRGQNSNILFVSSEKWVKFLETNGLSDPHFSNKMSSRISLEIKFWITFNTGPETRNFQGASAQIQLAQKGSIFPKKSLIFISKMAILGSFRGGSEVAFVTSVFFALSSVTYWSVAEARIWTQLFFV